MAPGRDVPESPAPAADEVVIAVEAAPITGSDLSVIAGIYGVRPELPAIGGFEGVGRVAAAGRDVTHFKEGDLRTNAGDPVLTTRPVGGGERSPVQRHDGVRLDVQPVAVEDKPVWPAGWNVAYRPGITGAEVRRDRRRARASSGRAGRPRSDGVRRPRICRRHRPNLTWPSRGRAGPGPRPW